MGIDAQSPSQLDGSSAGRELLRRAREEAIGLFLPLPHQRNLLLDDSRETWLIAANRGGKSEVGAVKTVLLALGMHPTIAMPVPNRGVAVALSFELSLSVSLDKILTWMPREAIESIPNMTTNKTLKIRDDWGGSEIDFRSQDQGREKLQGMAYHHGWVDEELEEYEYYLELKTRLIDYKGYLTCTMTPLKGLTWVFMKIVQGLARQPGSGVRVFSASIHDNTSLDPIEVERFLRDLPDDQRRARGYGEFINISGLPIFDRVALSERSADREETAPKVKERWTDVDEAPDHGTWAHADGGDLWVWRPPDAGHRYAIGVDASEGTPGGDQAYIQVVDASTLEQCAEWCGHITPHRLAHATVSLAKRYNDALVTIEVTGGWGSATMDRAQELLPAHRFYRRIAEHRDDGALAKGRMLGFSTNKATKPIAVSDMQEWARDDVTRIRSTRLIGQMQTFVQLGAGKTGAIVGCNDDAVMAMAVCLQGAKQVPLQATLKAVNTATRREKVPDPAIEKKKRGTPRVVRAMARALSRWMRPKNELDREPRGPQNG